MASDMASDMGSDMASASHHEPATAKPAT